MVSSSPFSHQLLINKVHRDLKPKNTGMKGNTTCLQPRLSFYVHSIYFLTALVIFPFLLVLVSCKVLDNKLDLEVIDASNDEIHSITDEPDAATFFPDDQEHSMFAADVLDQMFKSTASIFGGHIGIQTNEPTTEGHIPAVTSTESSSTSFNSDSNRTRSCGVIRNTAESVAKVIADTLVNLMADIFILDCDLP